MAAFMALYLKVLIFFLFAPGLSTPAGHGPPGLIPPGRIPPGRTAPGRTPSLLTASEPECKESYGGNIDLYHCMEALEHWKSRFRNRQQKFSRHHIVGGAISTMPQAVTFQTCSIGVDLADVSFGNSEFRHVMSSWATLKIGIDILLHSCVSPRPGTTPRNTPADKKWHIGGRLVFGSFDIVVINPALNVGMGTCLHPPRTPPMSLGRCIETQANFLQQSRQPHGQNRVQSPPARPIVPAVSHGNWPGQSPSLSPVQAGAGGHPLPGAHFVPGLSRIPRPPTGYAAIEYKAVPVYQPVPGYQPASGLQPVPGAPLVPGYQPATGFPGALSIPRYQPAAGFQPVPGAPSIPGIHQIPRPPTGSMMNRQPPPPPPGSRKASATYQQLHPPPPPPPPPTATATTTAIARPFGPLNRYSGRGGGQQRPLGDGSGD
ncbi:hypothetical protein MMC30_006661 [Trapelia coarctata]|nr:hypothetical protein [Trapelia coarctata]